MSFRTLTKKLMNAILIILGISILQQNAIAQTRLGLHVTQEELNIWKQRAQSGPYKSSGDVRSNSPGDWDRIVSNKNIFLSNPSAHRWAGQTSNSCVMPEGLTAPGRNQGRPLMEAAFYYLVNTSAPDRETVRLAVRDELLAQAATAGTNFTNTSRWCLGSPYGPLIDENPGFDMSNWMTRLLFAYDYIRSTLSSTHQATLDAWFLSWANFTRPNIDGWFAAARFPGRASDNYSNPTNQGVGGAEFKRTHFNGFQSDGWMQGWNNRNAAYVRYIGLAGVMFNNSTLKNSAKRYFKEVIKYSTFSDGTSNEFYRWETGNAALGWTYAGLMLGSLATIADAFARTGDLELYNYSTSDGYNGTAGGPKSLGQMITVYLGYVNGTITRYGTSNPANNGNSNYRIDSIDNVSGESYADDHYFAQANIFYRSTFNSSIYLRTASGAPPYPASYATGGWTPFTGEWGIYPGMLFQFGQMEGKVSPYPTGGSQPPSINFAAVPNTIRLRTIVRAHLVHKQRDILYWLGRLDRDKTNIRHPNCHPHSIHHLYVKLHWHCRRRFAINDSYGFFTANSHSSSFSEEFSRNAQSKLIYSLLQVIDLDGHGLGTPRRELSPTWLPEMSPVNSTTTPFHTSVHTVLRQSLEKIDSLLYRGRFFASPVEFLFPQDFWQVAVRPFQYHNRLPTHHSL